LALAVQALLTVAHQEHRQTAATVFLGQSLRREAVTAAPTLQTVHRAVRVAVAADQPDLQEAREPEAKATTAVPAQTTRRGVAVVLEPHKQVGMVLRAARQETAAMALPVQYLVRRLLTVVVAVVVVFKDTAHREVRAEQAAVATAHCRTRPTRRPIRVAAAVVVARTA
jgi:hypothetical protein